MNYRMIGKILSYIMRMEAMLLLPAFVIGAVRAEQAAVSILISMGALVLISCLSMFFKPQSKRIYAREGFVIVALSWIVMSAFGALPFYLSGCIPSYIDSLFETISGFTTTGASILNDVEALPDCLLFWRSFTHWIGGMGVLVFMPAVVPMSNDRSMHIMRAEVPGPTVGKLVPRARASAKILYGIYVAMTLLEIILLVAGGMPLFDSIVNSFATAGTGGFAIKNASIAFYESSYIHWVIGTFMVLFGINFNLFYFLLIGQFARAIRSEELRWYLCIILGATALITLNILPEYGNVPTALRDAFFQVSTIISTTGFATADFDKWPELSRSILVLLMILGSCAGSTGGGLKTSRVVVLIKSIGYEIRHMLHPHFVSSIKLEGKSVERETVSSIYVFVVTYVVIIALSVVLVSVDNFDYTTAFTSVLACINNIGPGLSMVGPTGNYSAFSDFSKIVLSLNMLIGRLEIFPILMLFSPTLWRRSLR